MRVGPMVRIVASLLLAGTVAGVAGTAWAESSSERSLIDRGRYLTQIGGCNDCHTPGYGDAAGKIPESQWLTGGGLGWRGPWGTTYPPNLRLRINALTEAQWLTLAKNLQTRPPMPWFTLRVMKDEDLRALYHFIRYLGPAGVPAPAYVPPDKEPTPPFATFPSPPPAK